MKFLNRNFFLTISWYYCYYCYYYDYDYYYYYYNYCLILIIYIAKYFYHIACSGVIVEHV